MSEAVDDRAGRFILAAIVALIAFIFISEYSKNNQIVPLVPNQKPAPVVPELPNLVSELKATKTLCEGRASVAINTLLREGGREADQAHGQNLYIDAKVESDKCIDYIKACISRRFVEDDVRQIALLIESQRFRSEAFTAWAESLNEPSFGATTLPTNIHEVIISLLSNSNQANEAAIQQLRADLEACRLRDWAELSR